MLLVVVEFEFEVESAWLGWGWATPSDRVGLVGLAPKISSGLDRESFSSDVTNQ